MQYPPTLKQREQIVKDQQGRCLLCGVKPDGLVIDHDHSTGEIRGALCYQCNTGLGMFRDSAPLLNAAIFYVGGYPGIEADEGELPREPVNTCPGSWEPPKYIGPRLYRCAVCDQAVGHFGKIKMELVGRERYMVREHYKRGEEPRRRGPARRLMSAVESIH